jgi:hypothetical protein
MCRGGVPFLRVWNRLVSRMGWLICGGRVTYANLDDLGNSRRLFAAGQCVSK